MLTCSKSKILFNFMVGICLSSLATGLQAQTVPQDEASDLQTIVVTAKNRQEKLQDVPLSITALSTADLRDNQVRDVKDLQKIAPNVSLYAGGGRNDPSVWAIRGLAPNTSDERFQGISIFLDGIPLSGQLSSIDMDNVERVEVIKGPQSATFGRATYSGAVNFISKEPSGDRITGTVRARGSFLKGSDGEPSYSLAASITAPLVKDQLWLTIGGSIMQNGRVAYSTDTRQPIGRERTKVATGTLTWKPDDSWSVTVRGMYTYDSDTLPAQIMQQPRDWVQAGIPLINLPRGAGSFLSAYMPDPDVNLVGDHGTFGFTRNRYFLSGIVTKMIGDYELSYRGAYFRSKDMRSNLSFMRATGVGQDPVFGSLVGTPAITLDPTANGTSLAFETFRNTSQQLMLLSPDADFRWRAGGYFFWEGDKTTFDGFRTATNPTGLFVYTTIQNYSGFGGFDWKFTDGWTLSGEGRVARETFRWPLCTYCSTPNVVDGKRGTTNFTPRVTLSYAATPRNMVYALYSSGVKSGRFSNVVTNGVRNLVWARPEKLSNFEIGSKNSFFGNRLVLNAAGFFDKVTDQQLSSSTFFINSSGSLASVTATNNVGKSNIWGFELEVKARLTPRLTLDGSVGYARQKFTNKDPVVLAANVSVGFEPMAQNAIVMDGKTQGSVPWWNGYIGAQYVVRLGEGDLKFRANGSYRGKYYVDLANLSAVKPAWTVDSRISYTRDQWEVSAFGRNLFNNQRSTGSGAGGATAICGFRETNTATYGSNQQCLYASPPRPVEFGLEAALKF